MRLLIDISKNEYNDIIEQVKKCDYPDMGFGKIIANGIPVPDITNEQISEAFQIAIANYWEEKSKYLTPPPTPTESRRGVFMASPTEVIKVGEPLPNSDAINKALEKGEIYKQGFEDARKRYERSTGEWIGNNFDEHICNKCGHYALYEEEPDGYYEVQSNFCPNCGADMREGRGIKNASSSDNL